MSQIINGRPLIEALRRTAEGYEVAIRFDWYRALPLSGVSVSLTVDGQAVPAEQMRFCVNDCDYALDELSELYEDFWFVLDAGRLRVSPPEPLALGEHEIGVDLDLRIPYLFDEDSGDVLTISTAPRATLAID
jgi:Domain of unknown function (DUF6379)